MNKEDLKNAINMLITGYVNNNEGTTEAHTKEAIEVLDELSVEWDEVSQNHADTQDAGEPIAA